MIRNKTLTVLISVCLLSTTANAGGSQIKSAVGFKGECVRRVGDVEDKNYCDENIMNMNFKDGYISFQFSSKEKLPNGRFREAISFVGPHLERREENGKKTIYLPVKEITIMDGSKTSVNNRKVDDSVCLLGFNGDQPDPNELRFLQCHYKDGGNIVMYRASNMHVQELPQNRRL